MVGRELPAGDPHLPHWGPNVWPAERPGFREATLALYDTLGAMANTLLEACALYLGEEGAYRNSGAGRIADYACRKFVGWPPGR